MPRPEDRYTHTEADAGLSVYLEPRDWWIGLYIGPNHLYVCPLPCVVIRWKR